MKYTVLVKHQSAEYGLLYVGSVVEAEKHPEPKEFYEPFEKEEPKAKKAKEKE